MGRLLGQNRDDRQSRFFLRRMNVITKLWRTLNEKQGCNNGAGTTNIKPVQKN
jgi:hypothetical protein